jgi:uncharacterized protein YlxW (UPF0749 family)
MSMVSGALLDDLLTNTLDPGYRAAAKRPKRSHWWDGPIVWLGCVAVGLVLVMAYQQSHRSAPAREAARKELISRITSLQKAGSAMDNSARTLAGQVAALRDAQLAKTGNADLPNLEVASGTVAVSGPGMVVQLDEPPDPQPSAGDGRSGTTPQQQVAILHDTDIRSVVNQLWSGGAEAVAVNGIRLTATSAIRFAGEAILVDFQTINAPYTVEAIGDRNALLVDFADSAIAQRLKTIQAVYNISFKFNGKSDLKLSSVTVTEPRFAVRGDAPTTPSTSSPANTPHPTTDPSATNSESPR